MKQINKPNLDLFEVVQWLWVTLNDFLWVTSNDVLQAFFSSANKAFTSSIYIEGKYKKKQEKKRQNCLVFFLVMY